MFAALPLKWEILISMISLGSREPWRKSERHYLRDMEPKLKKEKKKKDITVCALKHGRASSEWPLMARQKGSSSLSAWETRGPVVLC